MAAFAGEVVLTACMLQTVTRAVMTAVAVIKAILRIVLSLQKVPHQAISFGCLSSEGRLVPVRIVPMLRRLIFVSCVSRARSSKLYAAQVVATRRRPEFVTATEQVRKAGDHGRRRP